MAKLAEKSIMSYRCLRFDFLLILMVTWVLYVPSESASGQVGILDIQTPGLWDAVGREFNIHDPSDGTIQFVRVEIGEFIDGQQAYLGVSPTRDKINYDLM